MLKYILIASIIGTILWAIFQIIKPLTRKKFNNTWHYYSSLIPVFFLCGGIFLFSPIFNLVTKNLNIVPIVTKVESNSTFTPTYISPEFTQNVIVNPQKSFDFSMLFMILLIVWALGVCVFLLGKYLTFLSFKRAILIGTTSFITDKTNMKILQSKNIDTPILIGLFKQTIILPNIEMDDDELDIILTHELIHKKRGDLFIKLLVLIMNGIHWFNPIAYKITNTINSYCESSCDEQVVKELSTNQRRFYGNTILNVLKRSMISNSPFFTALVTPKENLKGRLTNIMNFEKSNKKIIIISIAVALVLLIAGVYIAFSMGIGQKEPIEINDIVPMADTSSDTPAVSSEESVKLNTDNITSSTLSTNSQVEEKIIDEESTLLSLVKIIEDNSYVEGSTLCIIEDGVSTIIENISVTDTTILITNNGSRIEVDIETGDVISMSGEPLSTSEISEERKELVGELIWPTSGGYVSAPFGKRGYSFHSGMDYDTAYGTDIYAVKDGEVISSSYHSSYGNLVKIDHGDGFESWYAHCSKLVAEVGDTVKAGEVIANVGSTGRSTGNHLHFEIRIDGAAINPEYFLP